MSATHKIQLRKGDEAFVDNGTPIGLTLLDYWRYSHSNIYFSQNNIAEFLVGKALGMEYPSNAQYWTLWDIDYIPDWLDNKLVRVEVKETSYYHPWSENKVSKQRTFSIAPSNLAYESEHGRKICRNCDIYVFCLNTGFTREESNPMDVSNWEFYVASTTYIDKTLGPTQKTVGLGRLRRLKGVKQVAFDDLKETIDDMIRSGEAKAHDYSDDGVEFSFVDD